MKPKLLDLIYNNIDDANCTLDNVKLQIMEIGKWGICRECQQGYECTSDGDMTCKNMHKSMDNITFEGEIMVSYY